MFVIKRNNYNYIFGTHIFGCAFLIFPCYSEPNPMCRLTKHLIRDRLFVSRQVGYTQSDIELRGLTSFEESKEESLCSRTHARKMESYRHTSKNDNNF